jgi:hypothetical protein
MTNSLIRKIVGYQEEIFIEGGREAPAPQTLLVRAAVLKNPWFGTVFVDDLQPEIQRLAPLLGTVLSEAIVEAAGSSDRVEAYGKAAVVGLSGEVEHGAGLIHTLQFGNLYRIAVQGSAFLSFINKRGAAGCTIDIPMVHKSKVGERSHFLTATFSIPDGPAPDEIVIAVAAATTGRPHHRIGDRFQDMERLGVDQTGKPLERKPAAPA